MDLLEAFLVGRGWMRYRESPRAIQYRAPQAIESEDEPFRVSLPAKDSTDSQLILRRVVTSLATIYSTSAARLEELLSSPGTILSIQLRDPDTVRGSIRLPRFEAFVEKLKKTLSDVAAFVITEQPTIRTPVPDAEQYVMRCRMLQPELGSYVARIQLPAVEPLVEPTLFDEDTLTSSAVGERFADILAFVTGPVFRRDPEILTEDFFLESRGLLNVDVLDDIGELFTKASSEEMNFVFSDLKGERAVASGRITEVEQNRLRSYVEYIRERVSDIVVLDVVGRIVKLHSRNPMQHRNYIAIAANLDGLPITIGVTLRSGDYSIALMAHRQNQLVRIRGRAQRLKTQYSITELEILAPVGSPRGPSSLA
jgi:hypothetical protein